MMEANGKINWISEAKGFAILGVVAVHTVQRFSVAYVSSIAHAGRFCVQLFFIISAYLTFISLDKNPADWTVKRYFKYLAHKIVRFIPVLYTAVLWHFISYTVELGHLPAFSDDIWKKAFFALTFLNGFSYHYVNPWMNWYIGTLVIFIAIAPLLKRLIDTPKKSVLFFAFSLFLDVTSSFLLLKMGYGEGLGWYFYFWLPRQLPVLATGIVFYHFEKSGSFEEIRNSVLTFLFIVSFGWLLEKSWKLVLESHVEYGILLLVFTYTLFSTFGEKFKWLKLLGDNSYGIYLYHGCLLPILAKMTNDIGFSKSSYRFVFCYIATLLLSLVCAKIANIVFEKPFFAFTTRWQGVTEG